MKKAARFLFLALVILSVYGCVEVVYEITIDENDLEHLTTRMGMPAMLAPYLGDVIADIQKQGFVVTTEAKDDKVWIISTKQFPAGSWDIPALPSTVTITSVAKDVFQADDYVLFKRYTLDVQYQYQSNDSGTPPEGVPAYTVPVKFAVTLPGRIGQTNAHERQGRTAVWNFTLAPSGTITMKLVTYKPKWALVAALLACLMVFAVAVVMLVKRRSGSRTAPRPPAMPTSGIPSPTRPGPPAATSPPRTVTYIVTLSLPPDIQRAERIIRTLAKSRKKTTDQIIAELRAGKLTIGFSDHALLERNLPILRDAGFNPKVTARGR
jgi:hypothetical protein